MNVPPSVRESHGPEGRMFWLLRQRVQQQREEQAMNEARSRWQLQGPRPAGPGWIPPLRGTIPQPLDHFDWQHRRTFNQQFWINEQYWKRSTGPVFLYIGGESALSPFSVVVGHHVELAEKHGALLVALEHRFYGSSLNHDGLQDQNLLFLSSQQALSDLVAFHHFITQKYNLAANHTWICFGGSYPGSLAAWLRLKFPHLVFAAVASSAPVRAQLDFTGYNKVVAASLSNPVVGGSNECLQMVREAFSAVDSLVRARRLAKLAVDFRSCRPLEGDRDCQDLVGNLADIFMGAVQYNNEGVQWANVHSLCNMMTNSSTGSPYQRLVAVNLVFLPSLGLQCIDASHKDVLEELRSTSIATSDGMRQWYFQTCTEFGYYPTCEDQACPFSRLMNLTFQLDICTEVFNISSHNVGEAVSFTNDYYGADHPKASQVLFVNGDIDPWHALSVLKNESISEPAILINGAAHCANMLPSNPMDPLPLVQARQQIAFWVGKWLNLTKIH
ncbi:thymus-specific serine protease [Python bivittatus]|uniref:Thymus-specific serine protease n=1 Tax=Python bivittatus TaxID=176946 RepID=A0A9F5J861_PYTBI|nr:thymus-specific serine protease [Python bivittatus]XP_025032006.1 thymus-specific serine protease [Python bivittatus]